MQENSFGMLKSKEDQRLQDSENTGQSNVVLTHITDRKESESHQSKPTAPSTPVTAAKPKEEEEEIPMESKISKTLSERTTRMVIILIL
jgi:hypothetical protein